MVEYKAHLSKQEEVKIAAEREEIKRAKTLKASAPRKVGGPGPASLVQPLQ